MRQQYVHWIPAVFCAVLVGIELAGAFRSGGAYVGISVFLPMCFFYAAVVTLSLQREIERLQQQVAELQQTAGLGVTATTAPAGERPGQFSLARLFVTVLILAVGFALFGALWRTPPPLTQPAQLQTPAVPANP